MRTFILYRHTDVSGISGTGVVAEGVEFSDGTVAVRWTSSRPSTVVWNNLEDVIAISGHAGATEIVFTDTFAGMYATAYGKPAVPLQLEVAA